MRTIIITTLLFLTFLTLKAQQSYDASLIPKEIMPYASAVIRNQEVTIEVKALDNVVYHEKRAITVLNKNGDDAAHMFIWYDKLSSIKNIKGIVYDQFGKQISKFGEGDFADESAVNNFSLFEDSRVKHYIPAVTEYPYTIDYEYEVKNKQSLYFRDWNPNPEDKVAVEKSTFKFICKPDFQIRYKEFNLPAAGVTGNENGLKTYAWHITNLKATKEEPFSPDWRKLQSRVMIAPDKFTYGNIPGSFTNWQEMGQWMEDKLLMNRNIISAETSNHVKELTQNIADPKLKAKKIYEYMQQKTHYISVQVGVGGYQPFMADDVDKLGYGDCKALVNYTQALLKAVNIDSYYCVVYGDRSTKTSMLSDFASMQGNHIILCLPFKNDTTWLDCTSQTSPFGFLGDFTDDRTVLACTPAGGKLMRTPKYTSADNLEKRKASFRIDETGELKGSMETAFKGTDYEDRDWLIEQAPVERIKDIKKEYPINNLEVEQLNYKQDKSPDPVTIESIKFSARDYASISDDKIYFMLNSVNRRNNAPRQLRNRTTSVSITRGFTEEDDISYTLPKGYRLEVEPLDVKLNKPFGNFTATITINDGQLTYKRKFQLIQGDYSKDKYQELVDFYEAVVDADNYNAALVKAKAN